jgi:hypothetical protein
MKVCRYVTTWSISIKTLWPHQTWWTELLSGFYITPKIHKNLIVSRSIWTAHFSMIFLAFALALRVLMVVHNHIKARVRETSLKPFYCVCLSTDKVLQQIKHSHTTNKDVKSYFHLRDFVSMYSNLDLVWCIKAILQLLTKFGKYINNWLW